MGAEAERSVRALAEAINRRDVEAAVAVCDPEVEFLSVLAVSGKAYRGHAGIRQYFEDIASAWQEWRVDVHRVAPMADGRVLIEMTMHMRGKGKRRSALGADRPHLDSPELEAAAKRTAARVRVSDRAIRRWSTAAIEPSPRGGCGVRDGSGGRGRPAVADPHVGQDPIEPARHLPGGGPREPEQHRHQH